MILRRRSLRLPPPCPPRPILRRNQSPPRNPRRRSKSSTRSLSAVRRPSVDCTLLLNGLESVLMICPRLPPFHRHYNAIGLTIPETGARAFAPPTVPNQMGKDRTLTNSNAASPNSIARPMATVLPSWTILPP